jgi:restriction endonuclease S subunit
MIHTLYIVQEMKLRQLAKIRPGHLNRAPIEPCDEGSNRLIQGRDVEAGILEKDDSSLIRFNPDHVQQSATLRDEDIVFMARGARNYAALLTRVPDRTLATASFFEVRASRDLIDPAYLAWYLNLPQTQHYFTQNSGRGVHMPVVRKSVLEDLDVPVPPLATQSRIAGLYRLQLEEQELTKALLEKRALLLEAAGLQAAERETP